jgi:copper/silver efflux system protein
MNTIPGKESFVDRIIRFNLENKLIVFIILAMILLWGLIVAPFDWDTGGLLRNPVGVDAIPDIGENQQIVFTDWEGRSPKDIENQITYPLTVSLLGLPEVKTVRSFSMFGFSSIYVIFNEKVDFYWSRSRILEKLNSLSPGILPDGVQPKLGPDATALGQVFWYTLEGQDDKGNPTGGWDLHELRSIQDWQVRYPLLSSEGVSEVASVGGFVKEYQIDVDPVAMKSFGVGIGEVVRAVQMSNNDVGARTIEVNRSEYLIRGIGFIKSLEDIEHAVIAVYNNVPVTVKQVANVQFGPAYRDGVLDKEGAEAVGGVVIVRYGVNPLAAIKNVKKKIAEISPGLPKKILPDGTESQVRIVPFYDRTGLIYETLGTLNSALVEEILITIIVIIIMVMHLRSSILISGLLPIAVLMSFIAMKLFGVDANIVSLSGIAIAIGTMVDMGIVICENILKHIEKSSPEDDLLEIVFRASSEVGSAVLTAVSTTVVGFLPVFTMQSAEGKLFKPLAFTKTFALISSVIVAIALIPPFAHILFTRKKPRKETKRIVAAGLMLLGCVIALKMTWWVGLIIVAGGIYYMFGELVPLKIHSKLFYVINGFFVAVVTIFLTAHWMPIGPGRGLILNLLFVIMIIGPVLGFYLLFYHYYKPALAWSLNHKKTTLSIPLFTVLLGFMTWLGFDTYFGWFPDTVMRTGPVSRLAHLFPGFGKEFMPPLDEGSFLYMPTTMPHASVGEAQDILRKQDTAIHDIPEIETVVGKAGRVESPLDPAPVSMIETVINYKQEYITDANGRIQTFAFDPDNNDYFRDVKGAVVFPPDGQPYLVKGTFIRQNSELVPDRHGKPFRQWRPRVDLKLNPGRDAWQGISNPQDIWDEIIVVADMPGVTSAPKLQPIAARVVMLQTGLRAPMGIKILGSDLSIIEKFGMEIEKYLKEVPSIETASVIADRIIGKPYEEITIDREAIARYGIALNEVQDVIETAIGGKMISTTVEGRERYPIRVRYQRELRDTIEDIGTILIPAPTGAQIPISQLANIEYIRGPQMIKGENTQLAGYVLFDKKPSYAEVDVVEMAEKYLEGKIQSGELDIPEGISYSFTGNYENQIRSQKRLALVLPLALSVIFLILYLQFRSVPTSILVFSGIFISWAGGFIMIWLYNQTWFLDFTFWGVNFRELFQVHPLNLSVAIWVGFLALFGIASDDGVLQATYLTDSFRRSQPGTVNDIRAAALEAGLKRIRPCLMTTATTILALIPVLTSSGRGSDIMIPMAIPSFGGMMIETMSLFVVPVIFAWMKEFELKRKQG